MNYVPPRRLIFALICALVVTACSESENERQRQRQNDPLLTDPAGRYQAVQDPTGRGIYVIDTRFGSAGFCSTDLGGYTHCNSAVPSR